MHLSMSTRILETMAALLAGLCWYLLLRILKTVWNDFFQWGLFEMSQRNAALCLVSSQRVLPSAPVLTFSACLLSCGRHEM